MLYPFQPKHVNKHLSSSDVAVGKRKFHLFIHPFHKHLLSAYYVPGTTLGTDERLLEKKKKR